MEFQEVVRRRRMVRNFSDEPVGVEVIERLAAIAQRAPSAGFSQGQRLIAVTDAALRRTLAECAGEDGYDEMGFGRWIAKAPVQFVPCVSEKVYRDRYDEPDKRRPGDEPMDWPIPYWWMDVGCTVENLLLAAVDEGLAAGFAGPQDIEGMRAALGLPADFAPVGVIPVGHPLPDKRSPSLKRGWVAGQDFLRWEGWLSRPPERTGPADTPRP
jgi:FMN reductase [NAD(P)H]